MILPFSWIVMIFGWSFLTKHPNRKRLLRKVTFLLIIIFSNPWLTHKAIEILEEKPVLPQRSYDIGIVLSGMLKTGMNLPEQIHLSQGADRIIEAIRLYKSGVIKKILITGGKADINFPEENEGDILADLVRSMGVPDSAIILEARARNTFENAKFTSELLGNNSENLLLITSAFHMKRAASCFRKQQLKFDIYPVDFMAPSKFNWSDMIPRSSALENWNMIIKEIVGLIIYRMVGYI